MQDNNIIRDAINCLERLQKENIELKAENERLKEKILKWQTAYSKQYQINENKGYNKKEEQYRQTLQEIKAIAKNEIKEFTNSAVHGGRYLEILQLITKAESEG